MSVLVYTMLWEVGAKDRISVDVGRKPYRPHTGVLIGLIANLPNILIALLFAIGAPFMATNTFAGSMNAVLNTTSALSEGMYRGLLSVMTVSGKALYLHWWSYFLIFIPSVVTAWVAYFAGFKNFRMIAAYFNKNAKKK